LLTAIISSSEYADTTGRKIIAIAPGKILFCWANAHKVALGLYFEHFREVLPNEGRVSAIWRSKADFAKKGVPKDLFVIMKRYGTLQQGKWNARETFEYRFEVNKEDGLFACMARLRGGLFVAGFAAKHATMLPSDEAQDWIIPSNLLGMMDDPRFEKKEQEIVGPHIFRRH
jgi:hypothetical protein